jgi:hypothetical protein
MPDFQSIEIPGGMERVVDRALADRTSRGEVLRRGAIVVGALSGWGLVSAETAFAASGAQPKPIPGGLDQNFNPVPNNPFVHVLPPAVGFEMATITDFRGVLAAAEIQGTAKGSDGSRYTFDADMRFMRGRYVGRDGRRRWGSFGFI